MVLIKKKKKGILPCGLKIVQFSPSAEWGNVPVSCSHGSGHCGLINWNEEPRHQLLAKRDHGADPMPGLTLSGGLPTQVKPIAISKPQDPPNCLSEPRISYRGDTQGWTWGRQHFPLASQRQLGKPLLYPASREDVDTQQGV